MNYFGHSAVASWAAPAAEAAGGLALGAMLPDFATMCRARLGEPADPNVARGVALHHATDAAFHRLPEVVAGMRELDDRLARGGCARGPRRAAAHVGFELLLDGVLVDDASYRASYLAGLAHDASGVRWRDPEGDERFAVVLARLRVHGVPEDLRAPAAITARLHRMLAHRPLLAPSNGDLVAIEHALVEGRPHVEAATTAILLAMRGCITL